MKKSMSSAYTDMMTNLAKSTAAIPLHLQKATEALAWWESPDSLLAKSSVGDEPEGGSETLQKGSVADKMRGLRQEGRNFEASTAKELANTYGTGDGAEMHATFLEATKGAVKTNKKQKATLTGKAKAAADHNHEWNQGRYEGLRDNPVKKALADLDEAVAILSKGSAEHETDEAYEEDHDRAEQHADDAQELPNSTTDIHGGHEADEADASEDEDDVKKSLAELSAIAGQVLAKSRTEA